MLWVPQHGTTRYQTNISSTSATELGTAIVSASSETSKGSIVELISSTNFDVFLVDITISRFGSADFFGRACVDLMIGASGSEVVLIPDMLAGHAGSFSKVQITGPKQWMFPLYIPAGTRIAARVASSIASHTGYIAVQLMGGDGSPRGKIGTKVTTYGVATLANGTSITEGGSGAEGSWTQITSSTSLEHFCLVPSYQLNGSVSAQFSSYVDIGIGAASSEVQVGPTYVWGSAAHSAQNGPFGLLPIFQTIPSGTRLAMRASNSSTARTVQGAIHGVS